MVTWVGPFVGIGPCPALVEMVNVPGTLYPAYDTLKVTVSVPTTPFGLNAQVHVFTPVWFSVTRPILFG